MQNLSAKQPNAGIKVMGRPVAANRGTHGLRHTRSLASLFSVLCVCGREGQAVAGAFSKKGTMFRMARLTYSSFSPTGAT